MQYFGIKEEDTPALAIHDAASNSKYLQASASPEDVKAFIAQYEVCTHNAACCCFLWKFFSMVACVQPQHCRHLCTTIHVAVCTVVRVSLYDPDSVLIADICTAQYA